MLHNRGFEFSVTMETALIASGYAYIKALNNINEDDIQEIKRCAVGLAWKHGLVRQLKQLSSEIDKKKVDFLEKLKKFKKKIVKQVTRMNHGITENLDWTAPTGKYFNSINSCI